MAPLQSEDRQFRHMDDARVALRLGLIVEELRELFADGFGIEAQVLLTVKCPDGVYRCDASEAGMIEEAMTRAELFSDQRSEEHTSELQSLMRISYAVFCLKKK